jgi:hypothetical protein
MGSANSCCGKNSTKRGLCFAEKLLQPWSLQTPIVSKDAAELHREASRTSSSSFRALPTSIVSKDAVDRGVSFTEKRRERSAALELCKLLSSAKMQSIGEWASPRSGKRQERSTVRELCELLSLARMQSIEAWASPGSVANIQQFWGSAEKRQERSAVLGRRKLLPSLHRWLLGSGQAAARAY